MVLTEAVSSQSRQTQGKPRIIDAQREEEEWLNVPSILTRQETAAREETNIISKSWNSSRSATINKGPRYPLFH